MYLTFSPAPHLRATNERYIPSTRRREITAETANMENPMPCPKCKAKIGTMIQRFLTDSGPAFGVLCYMCGCWIQGHSRQLEKAEEIQAAVS
jgi:hypothetical protein